MNKSRVQLLNLAPGWKRIDTAPTDGTVVTIGRNAFGTTPYPIKAAFLDGEWHMNIGTRDAPDWRPFDPQPDVWHP